MKEEFCSCPCLMKKDMIKSEDVLKFLRENYSLEGFLEQLERLPARDLKCSYCLLEVARKKVEGKEACYEGESVERLMIAYSAVAKKYILEETIPNESKLKLKDRLKKMLLKDHF